METNVKYMGHTLSTKNLSGHKSCFGCLYEQNRFCTWFSTHRGGRGKEIPTDVFNKGCKLREPSVENEEHSEIVQKIIDVFNGEIGEEQTVRRDRPWKKWGNRIYKRK